MRLCFFFFWRPKVTDSSSFLQQRGRHADIIKQALETYNQWMLDDCYDSMTKLHEIMATMRYRFEMSEIPSAEGNSK
jgi:hypothetical protein